MMCPQRSRRNSISCGWAITDFGDRLVVVQGGVRGVEDLVAGLAGPQAKIGVVEGDRQVLLIQPANGVEYLRDR